jgi:BirA family biotin operon repressor/biotin-[acetyl-CoA-carboxylase] ligase
MDVETRELQQRLSDAGQLPEVLLIKPITASTNDDVRELATKGVQQVLVCSHVQTQGRGQRQRQWISPEGNIYLSTLLHTQKPIDGRLALEIALNILQMPSLQGLTLQVKWPNDLYSLQGKWGGILVEPISPKQVVVGVGINLSPLTADIPDQQVTSLHELGLSQASRIQLIAELYLAIQQAGQWFNYGSQNLSGRFNRHAAFIQQQVDFTDLQGQYSGIFLGIQDDGAVKISTDQGIQTFYQGQLRLKNGE